MNCPNCENEINVVCSNENCKCRKNIDIKTALIWLEDGNNQECPYCGIIKHAGDWEDLFVNEYYENKSKIVCGFPGIGKSYLFNNSPSKYKIFDCDSSFFDKNYFPQNYIDHIERYRTLYDYQLISSHENVRSELESRNIKFYLVYPDINLKDEYIERYKKRKSSKQFINLIDKKWDEFIIQLHNQTNCEHVILSEDEYLSDVIY